MANLTLSGGSKRRSGDGGQCPRRPGATQPLSPPLIPLRSPTVPFSWCVREPPSISPRSTDFPGVPRLLAPHTLPAHRPNVPAHSCLLGGTLRLHTASQCSDTGVVGPNARCRQTPPRLTASGPATGASCHRPRVPASDTQAAGMTFAKRPPRRVAPGTNPAAPPHQTYNRSKSEPHKTPARLATPRNTSVQYSGLSSRPPPGEGDSTATRSDHNPASARLEPRLEPESSTLIAPESQPHRVATPRWLSGLASADLAQRNRGPHRLDSNSACARAERDRAACRVRCAGVVFPAR